MYGSSYYKQEAKNLLRGNNFIAVIGTFIFTLPVYILFLLQNNLSFMLSGSVLTLSALLVSIAFTLLVSNIIKVGYMRFLSDRKQIYTDTEQEAKKRYNFNNIVSGYTLNFKNTFKVMFLRELYLFGWKLFALIPMFIMFGILAYLSAKTDIVSTIYSYGTQLMISPSPDMLYTVSDYISANCPYLPIVTTGCTLLTIPMCIPLIRKHYEYYMIPMILADNPDTEPDEAFKLTSEIMIGHRMRFFYLQLSFIGYYILMFMFSFAIIPLLLMFYITPYSNTAYILFYRERREVIEHNFRFYDNTQNDI